MTFKRHAAAAGAILSICLIWPTAAFATSRQDAETAASAHQAKDATLRVVVRSLPGRLSAKIILTGPHHLHKRVTRSSTLKLPAGTYSLSAGAVKASTGSYYATTPHSRVVLHAGKATISIVAYATMVPKSTLVVPASATSSLTGDPSGPRVLTITGAPAKTVKVGDSLSSGVTAAAPYGYLVKVTKIVHKSGSSSTLDVENTTLLAAVPTGELSVEQALEPTAEASSVNHLRRVNLEIGRALHRELRGARARAAGFTVNTANLECESSAGVHLGRPTLTFSPSMAIHASWGFLKLDSASISITAAESLSFGATADAGAHCSTSSPGIGLFPHPITLGTIDVQVGPVPVTITPKLQLYLSGQASIEARATFSLEQGASVTAGVSYEHGSYHPISSLSQHFTPAFTAEGDASGELALSPTVDTLIYDVAGPSFDVGAVAKLNANVKASPWWTLQGCLQAGLGFVISPLGLNWSDPHLIQICKTLLSASTAPPAGAIAASSVPTNTSPPVITDEQGSNPPKVGDTLKASTGSWSGSPSEYTYQWEDCTTASVCSSSFTSAATHEVTNNENGETLRVVVTARNGAGVSKPAASSETGVVGGVSGAPGGTPGVEAVSAAASGEYSCAVLASGGVDCWGNGVFGEISQTEQGQSLTPAPVPGITEAVSVSAGNFHACAVLRSGAIECWGISPYGELGDGSTNASEVPVRVTGITNAVAVSADYGNTCAVLATGGVDCWGNNSVGQLGDGTIGPALDESALVPVAVSGITNAVGVTVDEGDNCAVLATGGVECWGLTHVGELGGPDKYESDVPVPVPGITNATAIASDDDHACVVLATGGVECWGVDDFLQLGPVIPPETRYQSYSATPLPVTGITDATAITAGAAHSCALLSSGGVDCWGEGFEGQLGNNEPGFQSGTPVAAKGITTATAIAAGAYHTCAVLTGGGMDCWGRNMFGELGDGKIENSHVPVPVSGFE
jgi:alpha-tubulin suppressor-like RCC1 family protein